MPSQTCHKKALCLVQKVRHLPKSMVISLQDAQEQAIINVKISLKT